MYELEVCMKNAYKTMVGMESNGMFPFQAYDTWVKDNGKEYVLPNLDKTNEELFFIGYAQVNCIATAQTNCIATAQTKFRYISYVSVF